MEHWKDIEGFEGLYKVSNLGRVKSFRNKNARILKPSLTGSGYYFVILYGAEKRNKMIHQLVAMAFLNHKPCGLKMTVNHIDSNKLNNNLCNLEVVTQRENCHKRISKVTSKYIGVCFHKSSQRWNARVRINGPQKDLGYFKTEEEASEAYQKELTKIQSI